MSCRQYGAIMRAHGRPWFSGVEVAIIGERLPNGDLQYGEVIMHTLPEPQCVPRAISLPMDAAQTLMDDLWNSGVRPTEGAGSAGAMRAAERHIADLRAVAFKALDIK
jgi:hypothetical protein